MYNKYENEKLIKDNAKKISDLKLEFFVSTKGITKNKELMERLSKIHSMGVEQNELNEINKKRSNENKMQDKSCEEEYLALVELAKLCNEDEKVIDLMKKAYESGLESKKTNEEFLKDIENGKCNVQEINDNVKKAQKEYKEILLHSREEKDPERALKARNLFLADKEFETAIRLCTKEYNEQAVSKGLPVVTVEEYFDLMARGKGNDFYNRFKEKEVNGKLINIEREIKEKSAAKKEEVIRSEIKEALKGMGEGRVVNLYRNFSLTSTPTHQIESHFIQEMEGEKGEHLLSALEKLSPICKGQTKEWIFRNAIAGKLALGGDANATMVSMYESKVREAYKSLVSKIDNARSLAYKEIDELAVNNSVEDIQVMDVLKNPIELRQLFEKEHIKNKDQGQEQNKEQNQNQNKEQDQNQNKDHNQGQGKPEKSNKKQSKKIEQEKKKEEDVEDKKTKTKKHARIEPISRQGLFIGIVGVGGGALAGIGIAGAFLSLPITAWPVIPIALSTALAGGLTARKIVHAIEDLKNFFKKENREARKVAKQKANETEQTEEQTEEKSIEKTVEKEKSSFYKGLEEWAREKEEARIRKQEIGKKQFKEEQKNNKKENEAKNAKEINKEQKHIAKEKEDKLANGGFVSPDEFEEVVNEVAVEDPAMLLDEETRKLYYKEKVDELLLNGKISSEEIAEAVKECNNDLIATTENLYNKYNTRLDEPKQEIKPVEPGEAQEVEAQEVEAQVFDAQQMDG